MIKSKVQDSDSHCTLCTVGMKVWVPQVNIRMKCLGNLKTFEIVISCIIHSLAHPTAEKHAYEVNWRL